MSEKYKVKEPEGIYFITITVVDWIDLFTRQIYKEIILNSLRYCVENKGLVVYAYVLMSSHLHIIVRSNNGIKLQDIVRDFKKFTSGEPIQSIKENNESRKECLPAEALA